MNRSVLAATAAALALAACGDDDAQTTRTVTQVVTATPTATRAATDSTPTVRREAFRSPSGNIGCILIGGTARCDIRERDWAPPARPADCELDYGQGLSVQPDSVEGVLVCAGDTALDPSAPPLPYGTASQVGRLTCTSRERGVECRNDLGHGFELSREAYRTF